MGTKNSALATSYTQAEPQKTDLKALLAQAVYGDRDALASLFEQTHSAVYGFALSILKNTSDAEDVLQDTYLKVCTAGDNYRQEDKPFAWILTVARNLSLMKLREKSRMAQLTEEGWEALPAKDSRATGEDRAVLDAAMRVLSDEERQVVILHAVAGLRHREIAEFLGLPLSTVLSKNYRALKKLKAALTEPQAAAGKEGIL